MTARDYAKALTETMMKKFEAAELPPVGHFHYHQGVFLSGVLSTYEVTGEKKYFNYVKDWIDAMLGEDGKGPADLQAAGCTIAISSFVKAAAKLG